MNPAPPGLENFRDIGGHAMATGRFFRSADLSRLTPAGVDALRQLNIRRIYDLRTPAERRAKPSRLPANSGMQTVHLPLHDDDILRGARGKMLRFLFLRRAAGEFDSFLKSYYQHIAFEQPGRIRQVLSSLADSANLPVLIHCRSGRDRTGYIAALLQLLAGVPFELVLADYLRTNDEFAARRETLITRVRLFTLFQVPPERLQLLFSAQLEALHDVYQRILHRHGSVETYLREFCEIPPATLQSLRNLVRK